jgi:hypothetical protein
MRFENDLYSSNLTYNNALCLITGLRLAIIGASLIGTCSTTLGLSSPLLTHLVANYDG